MSDGALFRISKCNWNTMATFSFFIILKNIIHNFYHKARNMAIQHDKCPDAAWLKCKQVLSTLNQKPINYYLFFIDKNPPTMSTFSGLRKNKNTCCRFRTCLLFPKGGLMRRFNLPPIYLSPKLQPFLPPKWMHPLWPHPYWQHNLHLNKEFRTEWWFNKRGPRL